MLSDNCNIVLLKGELLSVLSYSMWNKRKEVPVGYVEQQVSGYRPSWHINGKQKQPYKMKIASKSIS